MGDPSSEPEFEADVRDIESLHYATVGRVITEWSWFELWLDYKTIELGKIQFEVGLCVTAQIAGSSRKLDAYIALARFLGVKKELRKLNKFAEATKSLAEKRNRVVHDPWLVDKYAPAMRLEVTARKSLSFRMISVEMPELEKLSTDITQHTSLFEKIHASVLSELNT